MGEKDIHYYLVGGAVRDMVWGRRPREYDYAFSGSGEDFLQANPQACKVGQSVQVFLLEGQEFMPLRGDVQTDLAWRDLTINALALEPSGVMHLHPNAAYDLEHRILRAASDHAFADDPLRVFRFARFAAMFPDCSLDPATVEQARQVATSGALAAIPAERVGRELLKALPGTEPGRFLTVLAECEALAPWFAECVGAQTIPAGPVAFHQHSVLGHTVDVMNRCAGDPVAVWMALCHDLGKVSTDPALLPHHYGHEARGGIAALALAGRLALSAHYRRAGELAAVLHMKAGIYQNLRLGTRCDLLLEAHFAGVHAPLWRLAEADSGRSLHVQADRDLACLLAVHLPPHKQNMGPTSGHLLRELRCHALAEAREREKAVMEPVFGGRCPPIPLAGA